MKKKLFILIFSFTFGISFSQTGVVVSYYEDSSQSFTINTGGKLYFSEDNLYIQTDVTSTPFSIPVTIINKITFSSALGVEDVTVKEQNLLLYPNPAKNYIKIKSEQVDNFEISIYNIRGELILKGKYLSDEDIDISNLENGLYLMRVNGLTSKFIKE